MVVILLAQLRRPLTDPIRVDADLLEAVPAGPVHNFVRRVLEDGPGAVVRGCVGEVSVVNHHDPCTGAYARPRYPSAAHAGHSVFSHLLCGCGAVSPAQRAALDIEFQAALDDAAAELRDAA
jgi:hypothetical protein